MKEEKYLLEEFHRGQWRPLMLHGKEPQRFVMITSEQAEELNNYKDEERIRYVKAEVEEKPLTKAQLIAEIGDKYELTGKENKAELEAILADLAQ